MLHAMKCKIEITVNEIPNNTPIAENLILDLDQDSVANFTLTASDADNDALTYTLISQPQNGVVVGVAPDLVYTPNAGFSGVDSFEFEANDGVSTSNRALVTLNVIAAPNAQPIADAGSNVSVALSTTLTLDGSRSADTDNDTLTYRWSITQAPTGANPLLAASTTATPVLTPDTAGTYRIQLVVNDGQRDSDPDTVEVTVVRPNEPPVADAGGDRTVKLGAPIVLSGTQSFDPEGENLSYRWQLETQPGGSDAQLVNPLLPSTELITDMAGLYRISLTVNDGDQDSATVSVDIQIESNGPNRKPIANATFAIATEGGYTIVLDGSGVDCA